MPVIGNEVGLTFDQILIATDFTSASEVVTDYANGPVAICLPVPTVKDRKKSG